MHKILVALILLLGVAGAAFSFEAPSDTLVTDDYWRWEEVDDPRISPDGKHVLYTRLSIDRARDRWVSSIWLANVNGSGERLLAQGSSARWAPNSRQVAFLNEDVRDVTQIYRLDIASPAAVRPVTNESESVSEPVWSPDGSLIGFTRNVPIPPQGGFRLPKPPSGAQWTPEPLITTRLDFQLDEKGELSGYRQIFIVSAAGGRSVQLTHGPWDHPGSNSMEMRYTPGPIRWTSDGKRILFSALRIPDPEKTWRRSEIYTVDVRTRAVRALTALNGYSARPIQSPDGKWIAYIGHGDTTDSYVANKLYVMRSDGSSRRELAVGLDRAPVNLWWSRGSDGVYFTAETEGTSKVYLAPLSGSYRAVTDGKLHLTATGMSQSGVVAAIAGGPNDPSDVAVFSVAQPARVKTLTNVNGDVIAGKRLGQVEEIWYQSSDGQRVQGWLVKPPNFSPDKKYPLILDIHGGPHTMHPILFDFAFQDHAANGYLLLYVNPRGSVGYGTAFGNAIHNKHPASREYDDLVRGVDEVIKRGFVDERRTYVEGCSAGGMLTLWVIGQTNRFAAAAAACPISDWMSFVGASDHSVAFRHFTKPPWEDQEQYIKRSPLYFVGNVETPTLLLAGEQDSRTPTWQADIYYRALKMRGVPTALVHFRGEWHGTTSKPSNYIRTQLLLRQWFDRYSKAGK